MARKLKEQSNDAPNHKVKSIKKQIREFVGQNKQNLRPIALSLPESKLEILISGYKENSLKLDIDKDENFHVFYDDNSSCMQCDTSEAIQANTDASLFCSTPNDESMDAVENNAPTKTATPKTASPMLTNEDVQSNDENHDTELVAVGNTSTDISTNMQSNKTATASRDCNNLGFNTDILQYQLHREQKKVGRRNYMNKQDEIDSEMRAVMIDWFVDVCADFGLSTATFFLAVSLVDRMLSFIKCPRSKLQLVGTAAMFIATKMEEIYPPRLSDMVYITDDCYTAEQIIRMERVILHVVEFEVNTPHARSFADFFALFKPISPVANSLLGCLLELSAVHYECIRFKPSNIAAAAYALAVFCSINKSESGNTCNNSNVSRSWRPSNLLIQSVITLFGCWPDELIHKTRIARDQLGEPAKVLALLHRNAAMNQRQRAVYLKYSARENHQVSCAIRMPDEKFFDV